MMSELTDFEVANIGDSILYAPISGIIRGLTHDDVPVALKAKVIEVDPRGKQLKIVGIAERPRRIALGVLEAIRQKSPLWNISIRACSGNNEWR
jgi:hypothetical protein